jgi:hypothetical protein
MSAVTLPAVAHEIDRGSCQLVYEVALWYAGGKWMPF